MTLLYEQMYIKSLTTSSAYKYELQRLSYIWETGMKVHQFPRAFWDHVHESSSSCPVDVSKVLLSPAPKMDVFSYDVKSFIRPESGPRRLSSAYNSEDHISCGKGENNITSSAAAAVAEVEATHPGGTRWNPTQEQIGILEMLYKGGMRTPNANQIEQIAEKLAKYGKIEGKNVFYWFQNHKARERQKQKRVHLAQSQYHINPPSIKLATARSRVTSMLNSDIIAKEDCNIAVVREGSHKRRCRSWTLDHTANKEPSDQECNDPIKNRACHSDDEGSVCRTLLLFPLHPEGNM